MAPLPGWALRHRARVERLMGSNSLGPVYGPPVEVPCVVDSTTRTLTRASRGDERRPAARLYAQLGAPIREGDRVTVLGAGLVARVEQVQRHDGGGLPTPDHLEVLLT